MKYIKEIEKKGKRKKMFGKAHYSVKLARLINLNQRPAIADPSNRTI